MGYYNISKFLSVLLCLLSLGLFNTSIASSQAASPSDSMLIFYRRVDITSPCEGPMTLGEFVKRTLSWEIMEGEGNWSEEALKANAVAARSFTISRYKSDEHIHTDGQSYHCTNAYEQLGFEERINDDFNTLTTNFPEIFQAVDDTEGVLLTHPFAAGQEINVEQWPLHMRFGAIEASYKRETGFFTLDIPDRPWLESVYDPISPVGAVGASGMGQLGSRRWADGLSDLGNSFPKWDFVRILAHYYTEVEFVGVSPPRQIIIE